MLQKLTWACRLGAAISAIFDALHRKSLSLLTGTRPAPSDACQNKPTRCARAKQFAVRVVKFVRILPRDPATDALARQLAKAGPSVSANDHSAGRARSRAEFIARLVVVVDEADETVYWLSVVREGGVSSGAELDWLLQEAGELRAIFSASLVTTKLNYRR